MLVFDSTPLIYLAKAGKLDLLKNLHGRKVIPLEVYKEAVVKGKELGKSDAASLESAIEEGVFEIAEVTKNDFYKQLSKNPNLTKADVEVLTLAKSTNSIMVMDDEYARDVAESAGIATGGTIYIIHQLLREGIIRKEDAREILDKIIKEGWRCSPELYAAIIKKFEMM